MFPLQEESITDWKPYEAEDVRGAVSESNWFNGGARTSKGNRGAKGCHRAFPQVSFTRVKLSKFIVMLLQKLARDDDLTIGTKWSYIHIKSLHTIHVEFCALL